MKNAKAIDYQQDKTGAYDHVVPDPRLSAFICGLKFRLLTNAQSTGLMVGYVKPGSRNPEPAALGRPALVAATPGPWPNRV